MDREDNRLNNITKQKQLIAPLLHSYAKERRVKSEAAIDQVIELLVGVMHHCDATGVTFNDALAKARIKILDQKRPFPT